MAVDEKAKELCRKANLPESGMVYMLVCSALKEQDRDSRHACAEAVNALPWEVLGDTDSDLFGSEAVVSRDAAHAACVNAKAV